MGSSVKYQYIKEAWWEHLYKNANLILFKLEQNKFDRIHEKLLHKVN